MRIGLYGGTFDPIHLGHLIAAQTALQALELDRIRFIPAYNPPHKTGKESGAEKRLEMLKLAVADNPAFEIDTREIEAHEVVYSIDTLNAIRMASPGDELFFIIGEDSLMTFEQWYRWREIAEMVTLTVVRRPEDHRRQGEAFEQAVERYREMGVRLVIVSDFSIEISSSLIRHYAASGKSIRYLVPDPVARYIAREGLYRHEQDLDGGGAGGEPGAAGAGAV